MVKGIFEKLWDPSPERICVCVAISETSGECRQKPFLQKHTFETSIGQDDLAQKQSYKQQSYIIVFSKDTANPRPHRPEAALVWNGSLVGLSNIHRSSSGHTDFCTLEKDPAHPRKTL